MIMTTANYPLNIPGIEPVISPRRSPFDYALFTLPHVLLNGINIVTNEKAPVIIPFPPDLLADMNGRFTVKPGNGVTASLSVIRLDDVYRFDGAYSDEVPLRIAPMENELADPGTKSDRPGFLIQPLIPWLEAGQRFHVFRISFGCGHRGDENPVIDSVIPDLLFGVQRPG
jgi:hypothetical protein